ncbi:efflux RND transporter periplasmic adaptor subunit [Achromobacter sp. GG226]|uniref:efflux RND transporter periplasmic adaptor subunit n=1 Tax=Verticiella alkaliphila TaxID=2779529 RepID=UPI001C0E0AFB|nr:efflux RND transporter periplasmic adaptor subunit [Verticiella sp. GG226]MBU4612350.1 efflux RND transporter periplasmic adaptor subunit [Verticiella sp. GG226]
MDGPRHDGAMRIRRGPWMVVAASLLLAGCADTEPAQPGAQVRRVVVEPVRAAQPAAGELTLAGRVASPRASQLAFEVAGRLQEMAVAEGERVPAGTVLARLDRTDYALHVRDAAAQVRMLEADATRKRRLREAGVLSAAALDPVQAQLESARVALATARRQLEQTALTAPFAGRVARRLVPEGAVVPAGEPVFVLQQDEVVDVQVDLPEWAAQRLALGPSLRATGVPASAAGTTLALAYLEHGTQPDEGARTYPLMLRGPQPQALNLLPGMAVRVQVPLPAPSAETAAVGRFVVPLPAIARDRDESAYVWVLDADNQVQRVNVGITRVQGEQAWVEGELQADVPLVVAGVGRLHPGQTVEPQTRN